MSAATGESVNAGWAFGYLCECDDCVMCDGCADFIRRGEDPQPYLNAVNQGAA